MGTQITIFTDHTKFMTSTSKQLTFIDLFAGIGGFHLALSQAGAKCVFASEWDEAARTTYKHNFYASDPDLFDKGHYAGDITKVNPEDIPNFDIICGGFPCQPFSNAGQKQGFQDTRGTLFFNIADIIRVKQPQAFILENVRHLLKHDQGKTFSVIEKTLIELGYSFSHKIIKGTDFGIPQHRPRLFMVGFKDPAIKFEFPKPIPLVLTMSDILGGNCSRKVGFTLRVGGRGSPIDDRRNWDSYLVDGKVVRLNPQTGKKLQGFPDWFNLPVSETQAMKQLGNSVVVPVVSAVAKSVIAHLNGSAV